MSFFALGSAAATAIAGSAAVGLTGTALAVAGAAGGAAAAYGGQKLLNKGTSGSSSGSVGSLPYQPLDIDKVITDSRSAAAENYRTSLDLEKQYNPGQSAFRNAATDAAIQATFNAPGGRTYAGTPMGNTLLTESSDDILSELRLGNSLPPDVQAEVARAALQTSGQAGLAGSFAARGLVGKDIGVSSLALGNARRAAALQAGGLWEKLGLDRANFDAQQRGVDAANTLNFKTLADSFPLPNPGLDPGAIASLYTGNSNALNQVNQNQFLIDQQNANRRADNMNKLLGFGSQAVAAAGGFGGLFGGKSKS